MQKTQPALIAFDADDTLWENEIYFETAKDRFKDLFGRRLRFRRGPSGSCTRLKCATCPTLATASKAFTLSMIEDGPSI